MSFESVSAGDAEKLENWAADADMPLFLSGLHPPNPAVVGLFDRYALVPSGYFYQLVPRKTPPQMQEADTPRTVIGEWSGFVRPQGYSVSFSIRETPDSELSGTAILNQTGARPLEGTFTRISLLDNAFLASIAYENLAHIHIDSQLTGNRLDGEWRIFEAQYLGGTFTVWRSQSPGTNQQSSEPR
jgi:hypothetical protein